MVIQPLTVAAVDTDWLELVFREQYGELVGLARLLCDDRGAAEEIVQEAFVRLHLNRWRIRQPDKALAYVRSTVLNLSRGRLRRLQVARRHESTATRNADPGDETVASDARRHVVDALRQLPTRQRECMVLRYYAGLSEREIAESLGIAAGSVKSHIHRARATLAETLKDFR